MECREAWPFVSALHDGERIPRAAAEHITKCETCKGRLREYAQMGVELRLLASASSQEAPASAPALPPRRQRWRQALTARVLVPRFALGLGILVIAGLSLGFGLMRAQSTGLWFKYKITTPAGRGSLGHEVQAGGRATGVHMSVGPNAAIAALIDVLDIHKGLVRLAVRARHFEVPGGDPWMNTSYLTEEEQRVLANTPPEEYYYAVGSRMEIPVKGGGKLILTGRVLRQQGRFWWRETSPVEEPESGSNSGPGLDSLGALLPTPNQLVLADPVLIRGDDVLVKGVGITIARGNDPYVALNVPGEGLLVFLIQPHAGAVECQVEFSQARFTLDGGEYLLYSVMPMPKRIWVYQDSDYRPWGPPGPHSISTIGSGSSASMLIETLRK